jgi:rhamnose transport system ATP-binding protein
VKAQGVAVVYISHRLEELAGIADRVTVLRDGAVVATRPMSETDTPELIRLMVGRELGAVYPRRAGTRSDVVLETVGLSCRAVGVSDVSLTVRAGEIVGLAGLVGSGRTEFASVVFGLHAADRGELRLRGRRVTIDSPRAAVAHGIAYVPEDRRRHGVVPEMSVSVNATLAVLREISGRLLLNPKRERRVAEGFVERLAVKTPSLDTPVGALSGGNQQKVALARWLATKPVLLVLDEPTQGVDVGAKAEIHRLIVELAEQGLAILLISSEMPEILGMCDRVAVMKGGSVAGVVERAAASQESLLGMALGR